MKKTLITLLLGAATALGLSAESKFIGQTGDNNVSLPVDLGYRWSASQSLYTPAELDGLYDVAAGMTASITAITGYINLTGAAWLWADATLDVTLYVSNSDETSFTLQNGKAVPFGYETAVNGKFIFDQSICDTDEAWTEALGFADASVPVRIELSEPLLYTGNGLILTWTDYFSEADTDTGNNGSMSWNPGTGIKTLVWGDSDSELTADKILAAGSTRAELNVLPNITIEYDMADIPSEPTVERLPETDFHVGVYDDPDVISAGLAAKDVLPVALSYTYSGSQTLYTPAQLDGLTGLDRSAEISAISFKINVEDGLYYFCSSFNVKCYVKVLDNTVAFNKSAGNMQWFEYSEEDALGEFALDFNDIDEDSPWNYAYGYGMGDKIEVTLPLNKPVEIKNGQSLLITWVSEADGNDADWVISTVGFETGGSEKLAMSMADSNTPFESDYSAGVANQSLTYNILPVLSIHYTPVVYKDAEPKNIVEFESVMPVVRRMTVDPAIKESDEFAVSSFKSIDAINAVSLAYTIKDDLAGEGRQYIISLDNTQLGTVSELSGVINYVNPSPKQDMRLMVTPTDENSVGVPFSVAKSDIESLMPEYEVSVVKSKYYMTAGEGYKTNIHAAVKFLFDVPEDVLATISFASPAVASTRKLLHDGSANEDIDFDPEFLSLDADNWSCLHLNDRCVSFLYQNVMEGSTESGELVVPDKTFSSSIDPTVRYSFASANMAPEIVGGGVSLLADSYDIDLAKARGLSVSSVEKKASNKGYSGVGFTLDPPAASEFSGIESVAVDIDAEPEYFNLQGVRVADPAAGIYIRRQGTEATKVYVK